MCIYLVYVLREQLSVDDLYRAIRQARQRVRVGADNVMYNTPMCRKYYDFVEQLEDYGAEALESDDEMDVDEPQPKKRKGIVSRTVVSETIVLTRITPVTKRKRKEPSPSSSPEPEPAPLEPVRIPTTSICVCLGIKW